MRLEKIGSYSMVWAAKSGLCPAALSDEALSEYPILGYGWDEGAWANRYPDKRLLTERVPDHPVILRSLHGFAAWANQRALTLAGIVIGNVFQVGKIERGEHVPTLPLILKIARALKCSSAHLMALTEAKLAETATPKSAD